MRRGADAVGDPWIVRAARPIRMALLIQSRPGPSAAVLAREPEISERTVIRDAQALQPHQLPDGQAEDGGTRADRLEVEFTDIDYIDVSF